PNAVALFMIPPSLYHSTPNFGTLGGFKLNLPDFVKCGIFNLGNDQLKFMKPFILSIAPLTVSFALFIGVVIADLSEFQTALVFVLTESHAPETDVFTELTELDTPVLMLFQTLEIVDLILFQIVLVTDSIVFQPLETIPPIQLNELEKMFLTTAQALLNNDFIIPANTFIAPMIFPTIHNWIKPHIA